MKRTILLFLIVASMLLCTACTDEDLYYDHGYNNGYEEGYNDGYFEGLDWGQKMIADSVESDYFFIDSSELGDVITILSIYADGIYEDEFGEPMSEEELQRAIEMLLEYKNDVEELIYDIDKIDVY